MELSNTRNWQARTENQFLSPQGSRIPRPQPNISPRHLASLASPSQAGPPRSIPSLARGPPPNAYSPRQPPSYGSSAGRNYTNNNATQRNPYTQRTFADRPTQRSQHSKQVSEVSEMDSQYLSGQGPDPSDVSDLATDDGQRSPGLHSQPSFSTLRALRSVSGATDRFVAPAPRSPLVTERAAASETLQNTTAEGLPSPKTPNSPAAASTPTTKAGNASLRMPFASSEPPSPSASSVYTEITGIPANPTHYKRDSIPTSVYQSFGNSRLSQSRPIHQPKAEDDQNEYIQDFPTPSSFHSHQSSNPIIGQHSTTSLPGFSSKIHPSKRPAKLDISAVREMEARGSTSSLSDLIRRATKLASNLDRGRTASRLGMLDFGSSNKSAGSGNKLRSSTYSDVLNSFPQPENGSLRGDSRGVSRGKDTVKRDTVWPANEKTALSKEMELSSEKQASRRRCCGLSPLVFSIILLVVLMLIAAAILVPIFLILMPKLHKAATVTSASCAKSSPCQNDAVGLVLNNTCSCICVNGYTGSDCSIALDPECASSDLPGLGTSTYHNATIGRDVLPILQGANTNFSIPLNATLLLSTFARTNLSCTAENSLVRFLLSGATKRRGLELRWDVDQMLQKDNTLENAQNVARGEPANDLRPRQTFSTNGIIFAPPTATMTSSPTTHTGTDPSTATSYPTSTPSSSANPPTDRELSFGAAAVLYVLQSHSDIAVAVTANQLITGYFKSNMTGSASTANRNGSVEVTNDGYYVDFNRFKIYSPKGSVGAGGG